MYIPQIAIEGGDLVGKSTLRKELFSGKTKVGRQLFVQDRGIMTHWAYSCFFKRNKFTLNAISRDFVSYLVNNAMILLTLKENSIVKRYKERGDDLYKLDKIIEMNDFYNSCAKDFKDIPFIKVVEADNKTVAEIHEELSPWLNDVINMNISSKISNLHCLIDTFGNDVGDMKELQNITIKTHDAILKVDDLELLSNCYIAYSETKQDKVEYEMAIKNYSKFFEFFREKLIYIITKEILMNKQEAISTRRFHVTNDQGGCLNTLGINLRPNDSGKIDMNITANFRSSDIVILPFDIMGIYQTCLGIIRPKAAKEIFLYDISKQIQNFYMNINIESVHIIS